MRKSKFNCIIKSILISALSLITLCSCTININFDDLFEGGSGQSNVGAEDSGNLVVNYLDVGQGDSIFIQMPDSRTMLIDAGVSGEGESIQGYINDCGYTSIDYLVATHPHADHIGSMAYVVNNMDIGTIYMPNAVATTKTYENLLTAIAENGYRIKTARAGTNIIDEDNFTVDILGPETIDESNLNNSSVILKMTYGSTKFLFIGDAEEEELSSITADMSADVLKVGHHGSRTSTTEEFLYEVDPDYAVISCGRDNDYGHPHSEAIDLLESFGVEYFRTDEQGTIIITSDGSNIEIQTGAASIERVG